MTDDSENTKFKADKHKIRSKDLIVCLDLLTEVALSKARVLCILELLKTYFYTFYMFINKYEAFSILNYL